MNRLFNSGMIVAALVALGVSLWHDLVRLAWHQGDSRLHGNDVSGAEVAFRRAIALGGGSAPLHHNLGVSLYRQGEFAAAERQFAAALASADSQLAAVIRYNLGNCRYSLAEQQLTSDPTAAKRFLRGAVTDYGEASASMAVGADARDNLELARAKLAALGNGDRRSDPARSQQARGGDANDGNSNVKTRDKATSGMTSSKSTAVKGGAGGASREADGADREATEKKPRIDLSPGEAERLLNEARGRERPRGLSHGGGRIGAPAAPAKNW